MHVLPVLVCAGLLAPTAVAQQWSEGFEEGLAGVRPYHSKPPNAKLEIGTESPAEGKQFVRATLPGKAKLEGFSITAKDLTAGRVVTVTAQARGKGEIWLCLISGGRWLYSPSTVPLTQQWQQVSLSKVLLAKETLLGIYFISRTVQQGAVFEVDDVKVTLEPRLHTYDAEVGPWRLEAEDYALRRAYVAPDESGSGGKVVRYAGYMRIAGLPFPRATRPVTVYLRVCPDTDQEHYQLATAHGGFRQVLQTIKPEKARQWQWLAFAPLLADEVGNAFDIEYRLDKGAVGKTAFDSVVISSRGDLDDAALDSAPGLFSRQPLVVVARCKQSPTLDGKADDPCWQNTVACTGFLVVRSLAPATAWTTARLCYDDENLYALFTCHEPLLDVAMQRRHEFAAKIEQRDGDVYRDDCCLILLDPARTGEQVLDFTVNSLGTIADARCLAPDLWETRDTEWNSKATAAGTIGDPVWTAEIAIPFADLSGAAPQVGDVWRACIGRIAKARKENSSWNPSERGFHDPQEWGTLVFGGPSIGVELNAPASLQLGGNPLTVALTPVRGQEQGVCVVSSIQGPTGAAHPCLFSNVAAEPTELTHEFEVEQEAELTVTHGVLDAGSLQPLYLTSRVVRTVRSSWATVALSCDGAYELLLNEEAIASGPSAEMRELKAPLQKGANVFALKLEKGTAAIRIAPPGVEALSANWKMTAADTANATSPSTDDADWQTAPVVGEDPKLGPIIGEAGKAIVLRHTLLWEKTRIWPTPSPALYIARNSNQHITVIVDGLSKRKLLDWTVYLAVPPEFEILGSTGYYGNVDYQPSFLCTQLGEQEVNGRTMRVAKVTANKPVRTGRHYIFSLFNALVRYREEAGEPKSEETSFVYWAEGNDRTVLEPPQTFPVRLLPPLNGRQPKKLVWQLWGSFFSNMNNTQMREATLKTAQAAGINDFVSGDRWMSDNAPKYGMETTKGMNFQSWSLNMEPYLKQHPEARLITNESKPDDKLVCTTRLLGDSWEAVEAKLKEKIEESQPHTLDYDYEYPPFSGPHSCYCPLCLAEFRKHAKLPEDLKLDPTVIRDEYDEQWIDFMAWRTARMFRKFKDTIHRLAPGTKFSVYSGYQSPGNPRQYGVNWAYVGELEACDHAGCGYGRPMDGIQATIEALNGIPALFGALLQPYDTKLTMPQVPFAKARVLRRALDATGGVLLYGRLPMDGRSWLAIADTTRLVAEFEDLFLTGKRAAIPGLDDAAVQALSDGKTTLVCIMNRHSKPAEYTVPLPAEAGAGREFYSGEEAAAGQTVNCALPPGEVAVYVLLR